MTNLKNIKNKKKVGTRVKNINTDLKAEVLRSFYCAFMGRLIKHVTVGQDISCKSREAAIGHRLKS